MKLTNHHGLPESFVAFAKDDKYSAGVADISVTGLIDSPRIRILKRLNAEKMETDVVDMVWPLFGTAVHHILESSSNGVDIIQEERLFHEFGGWTVSGAIDHQKIVDGAIQITDYKVTSVWSVILGKEEWVKQQNCYAWLVENSNAGTNRQKKVSNIRICAVLRDWQRKKAEFDSDYPQAPVVIIDLPLWSAEERETYIQDRILMHQEAQAEYDLYDRMALCSEEEQWAKPAKWAVHKLAGKRALKLCDSLDEAKEYIEAQDGKDKLEIQFRAGERIRCAGNYCNVAEFCEQYKGWKTND